MNNKNILAEVNIDNLNKNSSYPEAIQELLYWLDVDRDKYDLIIQKQINEGKLFSESKLNKGKKYNYMKNNVVTSNENIPSMTTKINRININQMNNLTTSDILSSATTSDIESNKLKWTANGV